MITLILKMNQKIKIKLLRNNKNYKILNNKIKLKNNINHLNNNKNLIKV